MPPEEHKIIIIIIYALPPIPGNLSMQRIVLHWHHVVVEKFNLKASFSFRPPNAICLTAEPTIRLSSDTRQIRKMKRSPPFTIDQFTHDAGPPKSSSLLRVLEPKAWIGHQRKKEKSSHKILLFSTLEEAIDQLVKFGSVFV